MQTQHGAMGSRKMMPLLLSMSLPPMISMLIQALYNIVDSIFVARIGSDALMAVSLIYPLQNIALAVGVGFGIGICACIAKSIGAKNQAEANEAAAHGLVYSIIHSAALLLVGLFFVKPFLSMFTTDPAVLSMGMDYGTIVMCFSFTTIFHCYVEKMFQGVGNMIAPMLMQGIGAIINVILDPIFIFGGFGIPAMGVKGAAIATIIGQLVACLISVWLFVHKNTGIHLSLKGFRPSLAMTKRIYAVAVPSTMMMLLPSILVTTLNKILVSLSAAAVNVLGLYMKLQSFVYMPANGIIQGMRPIIGFNYGAQNHQRMREAVRCSMLAIGVIMAAGTGLFLLFPDLILSWFAATGDTLTIGKTAFSIISLGFVISSVGMVCAGAFEALGKGVHSLCISLLRQFIIIIPLSYLLVKPLGLTGIWITFPIAEITAAALAAVLYFRLMGASASHRALQTTPATTHAD